MAASAEDGEVSDSDYMRLRAMISGFSDDKPLTGTRPSAAGCWTWRYEATPEGLKPWKLAVVYGSEYVQG